MNRAQMYALSFNYEVWIFRNHLIWYAWMCRSYCLSFESAELPLNCIRSTLQNGIRMIQQALPLYSAADKAKN